VTENHISSEQEGLQGGETLWRPNYRPQSLLDNTSSVWRTRQSVALVLCQNNLL